ncbi:uncharacterized protein LOC130645999 [Hydractinia symbiolongicarpus]|uniref:uncharacterized protein LOC130645999 n=1 Tax=Hydractinia symbiolongicarpus TaxID=13093 RepID=UPI00254AA365|nr:uncharacterized protein LOC130645999 [Hydractinia symbiolongicarpus]
MSGYLFCLIFYLALVDKVIKSAASIVGKSLEFAKIVVAGVSDVLDTVVNPFIGLTTKYLRAKFFEEEFSPLQVQEIILGNALVYKQKNGVYKLSEVPDTFVFVSVIARIQQMLLNHDLAKIITSKIPTLGKTDRYYDVFDGTYFKSSESASPFLYVIIFQDAVEICNPLGNRSGKHKVVNFYWTLLNIPPKYWSKLASMTLFAMVKKKILDKYSFQDVLSPFFKEMEQFKNGVDFLIDGKLQKCFGKVLLCPGDTEGQHQIGGFKVGVGFAYRKCRFCYALEADVRNNVDPGCVNQRTSSVYMQEFDAIENAPNERIKGQLQTTYGLNSRSCLGKLCNFDVTKQFSHDIMHVVLEGVLPYECQLALSVLMDQGLFTLDEFNHKLSIFPFTYSDAKSKPEPLKRTVFVMGERKLKFSAENSIIIIKILPFILENFVDTDDVFYQFLMELSSITSILLL